MLDCGSHKGAVWALSPLAGRHAQEEEGEDDQYEDTSTAHVDSGSDLWDGDYQRDQVIKCVRGVSPSTSPGELSIGKHYKRAFLLFITWEKSKIIDIYRFWNINTQSS